MVASTPYKVAVTFSIDQIRRKALFSEMLKAFIKKQDTMPMLYRS
jgi:hypothetical protein